jgi:hypothetical protein
MSGIGTGVGAGSGVGFPLIDDADGAAEGSMDGVGRADAALGVTGATAGAGDAWASGACADFFPHEHRIANGSNKSSGSERDFINGHESRAPADRNPGAVSGIIAHKLRHHANSRNL